MNVHILGICGTFMAGVAVLAKEAGHAVSGSDQQVYPPMSTQLAAQGITLYDGYDPTHLDPTPDKVVIGNALSRGNPCVEYALNYSLPYVSGAQWLAEEVLRDRWVLAVAGTHGKTTTTSILAWILEYAGLNPGFLIGGMPNNFGVSARLGKSPFFVIEADEYDTAFFDKRAKFIHYHPRTLILNNLEYDHADIYPNLAAIQQQFHYLVRTIPRNGQIIHLQDDANLAGVLAQGCWTPVVTFGEQNASWSADNINYDGSRFEVLFNQQRLGVVQWSLVGRHNVLNALAAIAAAHHAGVEPATAVAALSSFMGVKRRLEVRGQIQGVTVYDDFAHHPTAIAATLAALRSKARSGRIIAVVEFGSYTMRHGCHGESIVAGLKEADYTLFLRPAVEADWNIDEVAAELMKPSRVHEDVDSIIHDIVSQACVGDHVLIMSNKGFDGIHEKLLAALRKNTIAQQPQPFFVS